MCVSSYAFGKHLVFASYGSASVIGLVNLVCGLASN